MQVTHITPLPQPVATAPAWVDRPDLVGSRVDWDTAIGRDLSANDAGRLTDAVFRHFAGGRDAIRAADVVTDQQWAFASDADGSDRPQFLYSHSTVRQELVSIAALHDAAAGRDGILERGELRTFLGTVDLAHGLTYHDALAPTVVKARQVTVPGRLAGAVNGHLIEDAWAPSPV